MGAHRITSWEQACAGGWDVAACWCHVVWCSSARVGVASVAFSVGRHKRWLPGRAACGKHVADIRMQQLLGLNETVSRVVDCEGGLQLAMQHRATGIR